MKYKNLIKNIIIINSKIIYYFKLKKKKNFKKYQFQI